MYIDKLFIIYIYYTVKPVYSEPLIKQNLLQTKLESQCMKSLFILPV